MYLKFTIRYCLNLEVCVILRHLTEALSLECSGATTNRRGAWKKCKVGKVWGKPTKGNSKIPWSAYQLTHARNWNWKYQCCRGERAWESLQCWLLLFIESLQCLAYGERGCWVQSGDGWLGRQWPGQLTLVICCCCSPLLILPRLNPKWH